MISKSLTSILVAILLVIASGTAGPLYFVSSQGQTTIESAEIVLSESEASPGSVVELEGADFGADSLVSIYFMSAEPVELAEGDAFILQRINANQSATIEPEGAGILFDTDSTAPSDTLGNLLLPSIIDQGDNNAASSTTAGLSGQNLLVVVEDVPPVNGTMSLDCEDVNIAQGRINGTIGAFTARPETYNDCLISFSDGDLINTGEIDEIVVISDSE